MALNGHRLTASGNAIWMRQETKEDFKSLESVLGFFFKKSHRWLFFVFFFSPLPLTFVLFSNFHFLPHLLWLRLS